MPIFFILVITYSIGFVSAQEDVNKVLSKVGAQYDERGIGFEVHYLLNGTLSPDVVIKPEEKKIKFTIETEVTEQEQWLGLILHEDLLYLPIRAFVDGVQEPDAIVSSIGETSTVYVPIKPGSKKVEIQGVSVIPEFGSIAALILIIAITSIIVLTNMKKFSVLTIR